MDMSNPVERGLDGESRRAHVAALLRAYPEIDPEEVAEVALFLKKGPILEVGLLSTDDDVRTALERFRADHASKLGLSFKDYLVAAVIVAAFVATCVLLWDVGAM